MHCILCDSSTEYYHSDPRREYRQCSNCRLVQVPKKYHLNPELEKAEYDLHQNNSDDQGYRDFLSRLTEPLCSKLKEGDRGLDFGCGPGPTLSKIFAEQGFQVYNYDPFYYNDKSLLSNQYQFVTLTEVIEHVAHPNDLIHLLNQLLLDNAALAIMTKRVINMQRFENWHYKNDPTHIAFYCIETFQWIAETMQWALEIISDDVVFLTKNKKLRTKS